MKTMVFEFLTEDGMRGFIEGVTFVNDGGLDIVSVVYDGRAPYPFSVMVEDRESGDDDETRQVDFKGQGFDLPKAVPLCDRFGGVWGEHPDHPRTDWQHQVANGETSLGYWDYVQYQIEEVVLMK